MKNGIPKNCEILLVCEGGWDVAFLKAMATQMELAAHPVSVENKQNFRPRIVGNIKNDPNFRQLRAFGVILDANDNGDNPAERTLDQINEVMRVCFGANANFLGHGEVKRLESGDLAVGAFVMPNGKCDGELENLLLGSARKRHPEIMGCVGKFRDCVRSNAEAEWKKESKKALQSLLSGFAEHCPDLSAALKQGIVNPDDDAFTELREFLRKLADAGGAGEN